MTLVEMLVSIGVGSLLAAAVLSFVLFTSRSVATLANYLDLERSNRQAMNEWTRDLRGTRTLTAVTSNRLTLQSGDGTLVIYDYSPQERTLSRLHNGSTRTLLADCEQLRFELYQRPTGKAAYEEFSTATLTNCKVIRASWVSSRRLLGAQVTSEGAQSARIVMRQP
jgi:hypothetical protein